MHMIAPPAALRVLKSERAVAPCRAESSTGEVLALLDGSLLLIDDGFRILDANANAFGSLHCGRDETDFGRYVVGDTPSESRDMRRKIGAAMFSRSRTMVALSHPRHTRLICSVKGLGPAGPSGARALVALSSDDRPAIDVGAYLGDVYKLSKAEAEIAILASKGLEVSQIMLDRQVSIHTLRAQIASIKAKMGLHRMTEMAIAVARIQAAALI